MSDATPNIGHWCGYCRVYHTSVSCYHPAVVRVKALEDRISELEAAIVDALHYSSFTNAGENMAEILTKVLKPADYVNTKHNWKR